MLLLLLAIIAPVWTGTIEEDCGLKSWVPVWADTVTDCLLKIPMNSPTMSPQLMQGYLDILIEYVESSSIFYLYMDGPLGGPSYDTLQDLKDLRGNLTNSSMYPTYFSICERVHIILARLKDCRVGAGYPYLGNFVYGLPFAFTTSNVFNSDNITQLEIVPTSFTLAVLENVTLKDEKDGSNDNLNWLLQDALDSYYDGKPQNFIIDEIDFTSGNKTAYDLASHALSYYALKENFYMRDVHGSYNFVMKWGMTGFNAAYMMHPTEPGKYNQHVWLKGRNFSDPSKPTVEIDVPFWGYYRGPENATWDTLSPLVPSSSFKTTLQSAPAMKKPVRKLHSSEITPKLARKAKKSYSSTLVQSEYEKMMRKRRTAPASLSNANVDFKELYAYAEEDGYVLCRVLLDSANKIGYLLFLEGYDFSDPEDIEKPDIFYQGLGKAYRQMVDGGAEQVIVDMRGHEGGYVSTFEALFDFLFHYQIYPRSTEQDVIKSRANAEVIRFFKQYPKMMGLDFSEWQPFLDAYDKETVTKINIDKSRYPPKAFTSNHSTRVFCEECIPSTLSKAYGGYSPFDAQHIYLLTDGDCFGGCAIMTLQARELNAARVLGYGWNPAYEDTLGTYAPGSCTGTYWGSDIIEYLRYGLDEDGFMNGAEFPKPWAWNDPRLHFTFTHFEDFSRNPNQLGKSLLYSNATVHEVLPYKVTPDEITIENVNDIATHINNLYIVPGYCFGGEVRVDPACQTPERTALHQLYGRPCDTVNGRSFFSTDSCLFAYCERNYYFNGTLPDFGGDCIPIPGEAPEPPKAAAAKNSTFAVGAGVALIVIVVILFVIVVVLIVYILVNRSKTGRPGALSNVNTAPSTSFHETKGETPTTSFRDKEPAAEVEEEIEEEDG